MVAGTVTALVEKVSGDSVIVFKVRLALPLFVMVTVCPELVVPTGWFAKLSAVLLRLDDAVVLKPLPESGTFRNVPSVRVTTKLQLYACAVVGIKNTE